MPIVRERRIFVLAARVLTVYEAQLIPKHKFLAAEALAFLVDTEDFQTHRDSYIQGADDLNALLYLKETILQPLMADMDKRKVIRPLIDSIDKAKRQLRFK